MAFKKTQGRSVFVSPTGMPNLSGFKQAAQVYDNVSKLGFEIGTDIRRQDFNDLILQAEADGRSAGAMYDDDNNLVPLTNLDVSQAIENQAFSDNEKEALKLAYKKAAIQTYAVSVSNDAEVFANNIFSNNPDNPDAIRGGLEGYLEGLGADDELLSYIKPSIVHEFVTVENKAQANKVIRARKEKEESNLLHVARLHSKIATIMAKGAGNNPSVAAGMQKMVDELQGSIDESYEALRTVGYNDTDIKKLREQGAQVIAAKQSEAHIERFYYGSGLSYSQSLSEIMSIKKEFDEQEGIDANAVAQSMLNQLNLIDKVTKTQATEANKASSELTSSVMLDIITGKKVGLDDIALLDVSDGQKYQLVNVLMGYNQSQRTAKQQLRNESKAVHKATFDELMIPIIDEFGDPSIREQNAHVITEMFRSGMIEPGDYQTFIRQHNSNQKASLAEISDLGMAGIERMMSPQMNYTYTPQFFRDMTPELVERGVIGPYEGQTKLRAWEAKISAYEKSRGVFLKSSNDAFQARSRLINHDNYSAADIKVVQENAPQLVPDQEGNTLYHSDPEIRDQNILSAVNFTLTYGALHPDAETALKGLKNSETEADFNVKMSLFDTIFNGLSQGSIAQGTTELAMGDMNALSLMKKHGIDTIDFEVARTFGWKKWSDMSKISDVVNGDRVVRNLESTFPDLEESIIANFNDSIEGSGWMEWFTNTVNPFWDTDNVEILSTMDKLIATKPDGGVATGGLADAYLNDTRLAQMITMGVKKQFATKSIPVDEQGLKIAIRNTVMEVADQVGLSVDSQGNPYWTISPWFKDARDSMGDSASMLQEGTMMDNLIDWASLGKLTPRRQYGDSVADAVFADIESRFNMVGGLVDPKAKALVDDGGAFFLVPNSSRGKTQTFKVMVRDKDDPYNTAVVLPHYRYDYADSIQSAAMKAAIKRVQNDNIVNFFSYVPLLGGYVQETSVKNELLNILADANDKTTLDKAINLMNNVVSYFNPELGGLKPYNYDARDVEVLRSYLLGEFSDKEYVKRLGELYED